MSEIPPADAEAILEQMARLRDAHRHGDTDTALAIHHALTDRYGTAVIAEVMADRDDRERLGAEVRLLQMFGGEALYGREE